MSNNLNLLEQILRNKVFSCLYWKEKCFALNSETIIDNALELKFIGGMISTTNQPSDFICLLVKMMQLGPSEEILDEYLSIPEYKYLRALTVMYIRMVFPAMKVYMKLEPLYSDYRKIRMMNSEGKIVLTHMDEFIDELLKKKNVFDIAMPELVKREVLEREGLKERVSLVEKELEGEAEEEEDIFGDIELPDGFFKEKKRKREEDNEKGFMEEAEEQIGKKRKDSGDKIIDENSDEYWLSLRKKIGLS